MSVYEYEIIRCGGGLKAYVGIQNDFTGTVLYGVRKIIDRDGQKYFNADGRKVIVTDKVKDFLYKENLTKKAVEFYKIKERL